MSEIDSPPENLKIPEHWQFEERYRSLPVLQVDLTDRYLALLNYPEEVRITDYFFDRDGLPSIARSYTDFSNGKYSMWRNIDRIVGARLSYSYPPPSPQK